MHQSEEEFLVLSAQGGDRQAMDMLYRHYNQRLLRYAYKICGTRDMAQEVVQEVWIRALKTLTRLEDPRAFRSWLYKLAHWRAIDLLRTTSRYCEYPQEPLHTATSMPEVTGDDADELRQAINRLPQVERQIIHLFYLDELQVKEVALVLGIATGTVKSRLNRARRLLKERFDINQSFDGR